MTLHKPEYTIRKWLITAFCLATIVAGHARTTAKNDSGLTLTASKVFAEAPLEILDLLRPSTRLDMLDYYTQADSILSATNALGETSRLVRVTPDYLKVSVTPVSFLEIKLLPVGNKQMVMTLYTTGDESMARDTEVRFFDSQLKPLETGKFLKAPHLKDFFTLKGSGIDGDELLEKIPYTAVEYSIGPGEAPLTAKLTTLQSISKEVRDLLSPFMLPSLSSQWKGAFKF
ncbi:MAG: DUF3256 family protein [Muribaculaceae bacterium]|nr:DUF3256 family protein [Muribaculaceae bacterium]MDE6552471.1 DUF3256 family protein [Muribaculaceae bacterium]